MPLIRIAPLIRFLSKAHPFGSPIYVTASQHVPFASTAFGIQRNGISETDSEARIQDATKTWNRRRIRLRVCYGPTGGRVL